MRTDRTAAAWEGDSYMSAKPLTAVKTGNELPRHRATKLS